METLPLRLQPGDDLRDALVLAMRDRDVGAAFVLSGIGSLSVAQLRFAGRKEIDERTGDLEILTLSGSLARDGTHLHMSVADAHGHVTGGHVASGCIVRTTAEILIALLPAWTFTREHDAATGYAELTIRPASPASPSDQ